MISEKTIQICGKDVQMRYCAAAETGYERLSGQSSDIFVPEVERDDEGNITSVKQRAKADDYIKLAIAAIIAAYARQNEESPITADDIMYDATPQEVTTLITTVIELRAKWYEIPSVVKQDEPADEEDENDDKQKNA